MKLRARFPQIGLVHPDGVLRRTSRAPSRSGGAGLKEPAAPTVHGAVAAPHAPVMTSEFAPPVDWPSTVAAWRSTTGKPGDRV